MSTETISAMENLAAINVRAVEAYNLAGKTLASAWRKGVARAMEQRCERVASFQQNNPSVLSDQAREQAQVARQKWNDMVMQRIDADIKSVELVMDRAAVAATSGMDAAIQRVAMIQSPALRAYVDGLIGMNQTFAEMSAQVADKLVERAQAIEARAAGVEPEAAAKSSAPRARKTA